MTFSIENDRDVKSTHTSKMYSGIKIVLINKL